MPLRQASVAVSGVFLVGLGPFQARIICSRSNLSLEFGFSAALNRGMPFSVSWPLTKFSRSFTEPMLRSLPRTDSVLLFRRCGEAAAPSPSSAPEERDDREEARRRSPGLASSLYQICRPADSPVSLGKEGCWPSVTRWEARSVAKTHPGLRARFWPDHSARRASRRLRGPPGMDTGRPKQASRRAARATAAAAAQSPAVSGPSRDQSRAASMDIGSLLTKIVISTPHASLLSATVNW
mmetsp:Transcript_21138/g.39610  ORF Transcript_21138/g.39610 Transcript_21138/m.39610 type:complete len:238 (+) Transcript_21138:668-1381(+)